MKSPRLTPKKISKMYSKGANISATLRNEMGLETNSKEIIEISYDLQTGSYIGSMQDKELADIKRSYVVEIARVIKSLCDPSSILEAGVGEATTLSGVIKAIDGNTRNYGFDLSWSRVAFAKAWLQSQGVENTTLCTGDLFNIPFLDSSIDVVYTSHSIEPNGGSEKEILKELYRVANKYLILLEPGYELSSLEAQKRMDSHGYCKNLSSIASLLGYKVLTHELFPHTDNPLNPTAITVIEKKCSPDSSELSNVLACPQFKTPIKEICGVLYSPEALVSYPVIGGIPCLRVENGVFSSKIEHTFLDKMLHSNSQ